MKSYIHSYLKHVRSQGDEVKNVHSVLIAGVVTGVFVVVYLYLVRDLSPSLLDDVNLTPDLKYERIYRKEEAR